MSELYLFLQRTQSWYGAVELVRTYRRNMKRGLTVSLVIHGLLLGIYWSLIYDKEAQGTTHEVRITTYEELAISPAVGPSDFGLKFTPILAANAERGTSQCVSRVLPRGLRRGNPIPNQGQWGAVLETSRQSFRMTRSTRIVSLQWKRVLSGTAMIQWAETTIAMIKTLSGAGDLSSVETVTCQADRPSLGLVQQQNLRPAFTGQEGEMVQISTEMELEVESGIR